jgi:hypothetical protein
MVSITKIKKVEYKIIRDQILISKIKVFNLKLSSNEEKVSSVEKG